MNRVRLPIRHMVLAALVALGSGCAANRVEDPQCLTHSEAEIAQAQELTAKGSAQPNWQEAKRLLLSSASCGNPKAPFLLGALHLFAPEPQLAEGYAWLSLAVDKRLYEATFASHLMSEIAPSLSPSELLRAKQLRAQHERFYGSRSLRSGA